MPTSDEQARNVESSATGEILESMNVLPSLATAPQVTFQETAQRLVELLATIGHEFRTPLMVINGYTSTLLRQAQQLSPEEPRGSYLGRELCSWRQRIPCLASPGWAASGELMNNFHHFFTLDPSIFTFLSPASCYSLRG